MANVAHDSSDGDVLNPDKFGLHRRFAVFQRHCNYIVQVVVNFIQCLPFGMRAWNTGNETDEQSG